MDIEYKVVFCHLELLRSSTSPALHLTQLAACISSDATSSIFLPVAPPVLVEYLDNYKLSGDLMQTLTMTREGHGTFLFRPPVLIEEVQRVVCLPENEALQAFLDFLQANGPNIVLVGLDEDTLGVLIQKMKELDRESFLHQVVGYTWWRRILKYTGFRNYKDLTLDEFFKSVFSPPPGAPITCKLVAERLKLAVKEVACRQGFIEVAGGRFVSSVAVPVKVRPRLEKRQVIEGQMEVLEVVNSYLAIPVTTFSVKKMEQVNIDPDESSEGCHVFSESNRLCSPIKQEQQGEEAIYISSDDEEMAVVAVNPRQMNTSGFLQPPQSAIASSSSPLPVATQPSLFTTPPPCVSTLPPTPVIGTTCSTPLPTRSTPLPPDPHHFPPAPQHFPPAPQHFPPAPHHFSPAPHHFPLAPHHFPPAPHHFPPAPHHFPPAPHHFPPAPHHFPTSTNRYL